MKPAQESVFLRGEGDQWFLRNRDALARNSSPMGDPPLELIRRCKLRPMRALEIGSSNGYRLNLLNGLCRTSCDAVEPSRQAIADGRRRYPRIRFHRGTASRLPAAVRQKRFDLVIVNFVFHWIGRENLMRSAAEIDAVVKDQGYLIIGDFCPTRPIQAPYHHLSGKDVWTFKQDYARLFTSTCMYTEISRIESFHPGPNGKKAGPDDRSVVSLLKKAPTYSSHDKK